MPRTSNKPKSKEETPAVKNAGVETPKTPATQSIEAQPQEQEAEIQEQKQEVEVPKQAEVAETIPANVERLMKLYPHYEEFYVTSKGFVHPKGAPQSLVNGAKLYKNKYFNQ